MTLAPEIEKSSNPPGITRMSYGTGEILAHRNIAQLQEIVQLDGIQNLRYQQIPVAY